MLSKFNQFEGQINNLSNEVHNQNVPRDDPKKSIVPPSLSFLELPFDVRNANSNVTTTSSSYLDHSQTSNFDYAPNMSLRALLSLDGNSDYGSSMAQSLLSCNQNSNANYGSIIAPSLSSRSQNLNYEYGNEGILSLDLPNSDRMITGNNIAGNPKVEENYNLANVELPINIVRPLENSYDHIPLGSEPNQSNPKKRKQKTWTTEEHDWFVLGLIITPRRSDWNDWKSIARIVRSKTSTQVASHAQKYFLRRNTNDNNNGNNNSKRKKRKSIHDRNEYDLCKERFPPLINLIQHLLSILHPVPVSIQHFPTEEIYSLFQQLPQLLRHCNLQNPSELLRNLNFVDEPPVQQFTLQNNMPNQNFDNPTMQFENYSTGYDQNLLLSNHNFDDSFLQESVPVSMHNQVQLPWQQIEFPNLAQQPQLQQLELQIQNPNNQAQHQLPWQEHELLPTYNPNPIYQIQDQLPLQELELLLSYNPINEVQDQPPSQEPELLPTRNPNPSNQVRDQPSLQELELQEEIKKLELREEIYRADCSLFDDFQM